jgi:hypothetical protein
MNKKIELNENELVDKFERLHNKFVANQVNKIQRYLTNNLGLDPINGKKPLSKAKVREFVTQREVDGVLQYAVKLSYGSKTVAIVGTGSIEADEVTILNTLKKVYADLYNDVFEGDFWNLFASDINLAKRELLDSVPSASKKVRTKKETIDAIAKERFSSVKPQLQGGAA